jgi:anti-sigma factor RsiW
VSEPNIDCEAIAEDLVAYVDDELAPDDRTRVAAHVASCLVCRREMETVRRFKLMIGSMPQVEPSSDLAERMSRRLELEPASVTWRRPARGTHWGIPLAAAAAIAIMLASVLSQDLSTPPAVPTDDRVAASVPAPAPEQVAEDDGSGATRVASAPVEREVDDDAADTAERELDPEDLPPDLLARPELYLRLPVVRRLTTFEHFEAVRERVEREGVGSWAPDGERPGLG